MNVIQYDRLGSTWPRRDGITLVEVIFSIGVVLVGLVGIAVILPMAGERARESVNMTIGASFGDAVIDEIQMRNWVADRRLVEFGPDPSLPPPAVNEVLQYKLDLTERRGLTWTDNELTQLVDPEPLDDTDNNRRVPSFCIDPMYVADRVELGETAASANGYFDGVFPYYSSTHDPLLNPSDTSTWPFDQPRMPRLGLRRQANVSRPFVSVGLEQARSMVERSNDLETVIPKDRSAAPQLEGLKTDSGLEYGRRTPSGQFSWIATISPLPGNKYASVSVVVLKDRDRGRDFLVPADPSVTDPKKNGVNERLAYVTYAAGFQGGAGGTVHLTASANTSSALRVDNWVMLSRRIPITPPPPSPQLDFVDVHRWYRVAAVDGKPEKFVPASNTLLEAGGLPLPSATRSEVWRHKVLLDGPDWAFGLDTASFSDDTFVTIMTDVVSVTERIIPLADL